MEKYWTKGSTGCRRGILIMDEQLVINRLSDSLIRRDRFGAEISRGDVCVWNSHDGLTLCVYLGDSKTGKTNKYGRFSTPAGNRSISYNNVVLAYDSMGKRVVNHDITKTLMRSLYG